MKHPPFPFQYKLFKGMYSVNDRSHVGYGIEVINRMTDCVHMTVEDISVSEQEIICLVERCNRLQLDPEHLFDVVQDHLAYV